MYNKWKVLIVDDEFRIGQLIKKLIQWDKIGLECIDTVDNGELAFKIIKEQKPDIVITDIRMPQISGLDLIKMTKEIDNHVKFVVISGYKEFEYAHKALKFGVNDYLLKPVKQEELNKVLQKIHDEITEGYQKKEEERQFIKAVTVSEQIIKSRLLNHIIDQTDSPSLSEIKKEYNLSFNASVFRGFDIKLDYIDYVKIDKKQDRLTIEKIISIIEENIEGIVTEHLICEKDNLNIFFLINYDSSNAKEMINRINNILIEIQEYLIGFDQYEATIGIGSEETEFGNIRFSINSAYRAVGNRIKIGTGRLIYAESIQLENRIDANKYIEMHKSSLLAGLEAYSKEAFTQGINYIFSELQFKENIDFSCYYDIAQELITLFFDNISVKNNDDLLKQYLLQAYQHCNTTHKLKELIKSCLCYYLEECLKQIETESTKPIRQAKLYIDEHYNEKIVLEDIASSIHLNPVYFSVLFKKETGVNFSTYLINTRMEAAKKMLRNSNETIASISDAVGYKDVRHFSQIFSKTVGIKPALYRKLHS